MASRTVAAPALDWQGSLFGADEPRPDVSFATAERVELADGAWVDVVPGWLAGADTLFERLVGSVAWKAHEVPMYERIVPQPRLSAWWSDGEASWPGEHPGVVHPGPVHCGTPFAPSLIMAGKGHACGPVNGSNACITRA